ncbi:hypothetical protein C7999DRAFT_16813, partial [Corynascus novoguineensis]
PSNAPFWTLARRPTRSRPTLYPSWAHQTEPTPPEASPDTDCLFTPLTDTSDENGEAEALAIWQPQDKLTSDGLLGEEDPASMANLATTPPLPSRSGSFVVSRGDALLLNTMDQNRTSANEWMDLLQKGASADEEGELLVDDVRSGALSEPEGYDNSGRRVVTGIPVPGQEGERVDDVMDVNMSFLSPSSLIEA